MQNTTNELNINYGINKVQKKGFIYRNGKIKIMGDWDDDNTHKEIRRKIREDNPGWNITGYCLPSGDENGE